MNPTKFQTALWLVDTLSTCFQYQLLQTNLVVIFKTKRVQTYTSYSFVLSFIYMTLICLKVQRQRLIK